MAGSWIPSGNDTSRLQSRLRNAVQQLLFAAEELQAITNVMAQMVGSSPGASDYALIETYFGVAPLSGQQGVNGQAVHDIVGSASGELQGGLVQGLLQRFG